MYYCPNCGQPVDDPSKPCPNCGTVSGGDEILGSAVETESKIIGNDGNPVDDNSRRNDSRDDYSQNVNNGARVFYYDSRQGSGNYVFKDLNGWIKLLLVVLSLLYPFFGLIASVILLMSKNPLYKSFGVKLLIFNIIMLILGFIFGAINLAAHLIFGGMRQITSYY